MVYITQFFSWRDCKRSKHNPENLVNFRFYIGYNLKIVRDRKKLLLLIKTTYIMVKDFSIVYINKKITNKNINNIS